MNRNLEFEVNMAAVIDINNIIYINYEFTAFDNADDSEIEKICVNYAVGIDARREEAVLQLYHLMSEIVASEELYAVEKLQAVKLVEAKIKRLTTILVNQNLYKVRYNSIGTFPIEVGIIYAPNIADCTNVFERGICLGAEFYEIQHTEADISDLISIEQVSLYEACKTILDI